MRGWGDGRGSPRWRPPRYSTNHQQGRARGCLRPLVVRGFLYYFFWEKPEWGSAPPGRGGVEIHIRVGGGRGGGGPVLGGGGGGGGRLAVQFLPIVSRRPPGGEGKEKRGKGGVEGGGERPVCCPLLLFPQVKTRVPMKVPCLQTCQNAMPVRSGCDQALGHGIFLNRVREKGRLRSRIS